MAVQVIMNQQKGPLPVKATFNSPSSAPMYLEVVGSVWTTTANQMIGIGVKVDDQALGSAQIFSNTASTHRTVVSSYIPVKLNQGQHTITLGPATATTTADLNDFYTVVLHY